ncbi:MAG: hypothetical protein K8I30_20795 [Anaerolineae bacterium]|nr:hypothetical protein [Anaerolineae bacterium]
MSKKVWIAIMAVVLALSAVAVMAQDNPGVIDITAPDGSIVSIFTDGRLNAGDLAAPVVVYYTAENGTIVNPNLASDQLDLVNVGGVATDLSGTNDANNANADASDATSANITQPDPNGLIDKLQVLAIDQTTSNGNVVIEASVNDLMNLVTGRQNSIAQAGYSVNFDPNSNHFWVQSPANFEGKVYTFAWRNTLFPLSMIGNRSLSSESDTTNVQAQATAEASPQATSDEDSQATAQPTEEPTTQPTAQPTPSA